MKKNLYFIALLSLLCIFLTKADISFADIEQGSFTLYSNGSWITTYPNFTNFGDNCNFYIYEGEYPDTSTPAGTGSGGCLPYPDSLWGALAQEDGTYWQHLVVTSGTFSGHDYYYANFYRTNGVWDTTEPIAVSIISITNPASTSIITDTATNLVGNWANIDPDIYHNITLYFNSNFIGEQSVAKVIPITNSTGTFSFALSYFGISANGQWDLKGSATYANTQLSDMYITPDLISPADYNLIFDVAGFHTPYAFTDFDTWYSANVTNYETPSAWASGMIGYLQPILEKIAEFGARIQDYLDTSTAWQRGNDIGSVFPVINAYILKINIFFGGFPIAQFFQWGILIMIGMFAIKIILKLLSFIPVIGGGG